MHRIFLGFTATAKNIIIQDMTSNQTKRARHIDFDEAYYSRKTEPRYVEHLFQHNEEVQKSTVRQDQNNNVTEENILAQNPSQTSESEHTKENNLEYNQCRTNYDR